MSASAYDIEQLEDDGLGQPKNEAKNALWHCCCASWLRGSRKNCTSGAMVAWVHGASALLYAAQACAIIMLLVAFDASPPNALPFSFDGNYSSASVLLGQYYFLSQASQSSPPSPASTLPLSTPSPLYDGISVLINVHIVIVFYLLLAAAFQTTALVIHHSEWSRILRWADRFVACPVVVLAIALCTGVHDASTLIALTGLASAAQLFGLCADCALHFALSRADTDGTAGPFVDPFLRCAHAHAWRLPYAAAWIMWLLTFAILFLHYAHHSRYAYYYRSSASSSWTSLAFIASEFFLFGLLNLVRPRAAFFDARIV